VFLKGCPLSCVWCHNPESISPEQVEVFHAVRCIQCGRCAEGCFSEARETLGEWITPEELYAQIDRDRPFFVESGGGVTFSGGEPLLQKEFLRDSLSLCSRNGLHTAVDTSGFTTWESFAAILEFCDLFLFDVKHINSEKHLKYTGVDNSLILSNLVKLISVGSAVIVRVPVARGFNDDRCSIDEITSFLASLQGDLKVEPMKCHGYASVKYSDLGKKADNYEPSEKSMEIFREMMAAKGLTGGKS